MQNPSMIDPKVRLEKLAQITRRHFLKESQLQLGAIPLASLMARSGPAAPPAAAPSRSADPLHPRAPHFAPRARRVIYLHLTGSPPHLDLYDYKPELVSRDGQNCPPELPAGTRR